MAQIDQAALDEQARRWLRPDWRRFFRPGSQNDPLYNYYERIERKYDPEQPRVPAGVSEGGQWTSGGAGDASGGRPSGAGQDAEFLDRAHRAAETAQVASILDKAKQFAAANKNAYQRCLDLCYPILERFKLPGSDINQFDFHKCMNACLGRNQ